MKKLATITVQDAAGENVPMALSLHGHELIGEAFGLPTESITTGLDSEEAATDYIFATYGSGWNLAWADGTPQ